MAVMVRRQRTIYDTFTGSGTLGDHMPEAGGAWSVIQGAFGPLSNGRLTYLNAIGSHGVAIQTCRAGDYEVRCAFVGGVQKGGIVLRSSADGSKRFLLTTHTDLSRLVLLYYTGLTTTTALIGQMPIAAVTWATGEEHEVRVLLRERELRFFVDDIYTGYAQLDISLSANVYGGVGCYSRAYGDTEISWSEFEVRKLSGWKNVLVLGDSISKDYLIANNDHKRWPWMLTRQWNSGRSWPTIHAENGAGIVAAPKPLLAQVAEAATDDVGYAILLIGTNDDAYVGTGQITTNYRQAIQTLRSDHAGIVVYSCGILNRTLYDPDVRAANTLEIAAAAAAEGATFWDVEGWIDPVTDTIDGIHPNDAGHAKIATQMLARL